ncbi:DUF3224 domain-containing protein [Spirosoma sp. SC4-14]|uniref:DUF3224 domain-containing protein n=1 Tax=Spirosoma sp. SC4-14 TaxID=3128900 RepID=UPI0030CD9651
MLAVARRIYKTWKEAPYDELEGAPKLTQSRVTNVIEGDIEGESWEEYLMMYQHPDCCTFIVMERVIGRLGNHTGSFVLHGYGTYDKGVARADLTIIRGSATGQLTGLVGTGTCIALKGQHATITLDYSFD